MGRRERSGPPDEKVTVNLGPIDVGRIDLLVEEGFFASRTDAIRTAVRSLLEEHKQPINDVITRDSYTVGVVFQDRSTYKEFRRKKERVNLHVVGFLRLAGNIPADLIDEVVASVRVHGHLSASPAVRRVLESKMKRGRFDDPGD